MPAALAPAYVRTSMCCTRPRNLAPARRRRYALLRVPLQLLPRNQRQWRERTAYAPRIPPRSPFAQHSDVTHPSGVHYCVIFQQRHLRREDDDILYSECWCMLDAKRASSTAAAPASVCERCVASPLLTPGRGRGRLIHSSPGFRRATALRSDEWVVRCVAGARDCAAQRLAPAGRR